ncbi:MAG: hydroxymethylbilane synthase [Candidatus Alcyoniella australis]|nr:hydroxymethylbilane synthase [Candidatus Alcyoniella australis]
MTRLIVGTRGSALARCQTEMCIEALLRLRPELEIERRIISTTGDQLLDHPLTKIDDKGLFTRQIEKALLCGEIDLAVHSLKDLPTEPTPDLVLAAIMEREDPRDMLVSPRGLGPDGLPPDVRIGTGSPRRRAQIRLLRPDCRCLEIRGNVETRLRKLEQSGEYDALVLAAAGVRRLGLLDERMLPLSFEQMLPAPGQGAMAVQCRENDRRLRELLALLDHRLTRLAVEAERALLEFTEGGCHVPLGAHCRVTENALELQGLIATPEGDLVLRRSAIGSSDDPRELGRRLGRELLALDEDGRIAAALRPERCGDERGQR